VNSFESKETETEQQEIKKENGQTASPVSVPVSVPTPKFEFEIPSAGPDFSATFEFEMAASPQISSELSYSCLLIPRFSDHYLTGDITTDLLTWMKEICISYGWRLDAITIRPGYLQWVMSVPLTANPAQFMRITRQQSSQKIFEDYPRFKIKNLSSDFWAPGFSVVHGNRLQSMDEINNYILQIRKQQGIT